MMSSSTSPTIAYVALGANLGNRKKTIQSAISLLGRAAGITMRDTSGLYETAAVGGPANSPVFLNTVVEIQTTLDPADVLETLLSIEKSLGRVRRDKWEPRTIDLDLILFGDAIINTPDLVVPHPLMHQRRFVLEPLAEIAPNAVHPILNQTAQALLAGLK
jgi:2-amino-4-hydroxy-6-hydroxymethyldihydropteridine diphosphokinase